MTTTRGLFSALFLGLALLGTPVLTILVSSDAQAQERRPQMSQGTAKELDAIYNLRGEEKYAEALRQLQNFKKINERSPYDQAKIQQTFAALYLDLERPNEALRAFQNMIRIGQNVMVLNEIHDAMYFIGQLHLQAGDYDKGLRQILDWFKVVDNPQAQAYFLVGSIYASKDNFREAVKWVEDAIDKHEKAQRDLVAAGEMSASDVEPVPENFYSLAVGVYYNLNRYPDAVRILEILVNMYPKKDYWVQLTGLYGAMDQPKKALNTLHAAYHQRILNQSGEFVELAQRLVQAGAPWDACQVLETARNTKLLKEDKQTHELQATCYYLAQEIDKALPWYYKLADASEKADTYQFIGQIFMQKEDWKKAEDAFVDAIQKNGRVSRDNKLRDPGQIWLYIGITRYYRDRLDGAENAFKSAQGFAKHKKTADQWIAHLARERKKRAAQS